MRRFGRFRITILALSVAVCLSQTTRAQDQAEQPRPVQETAILLNFKDASLDAVLEYLSEAAGLVVVQEVAVEGRVTVMSRQPLNVDEVVSLLNTVLKEKGYAAILMGRTLKVVSLADAKKQSIPVRAGNDPEAIKPTDELITQIIPVRHADAAKLKDDLAPLVPDYANLTANVSSNALILTDTSANIRRIVQIVQALDTHMAAVAEVRVFKLQYANATAAARLVNEVFKQEDTAARSQSQRDRMRRVFRMRGEQPQAAEQGSRGPTVTAAADERTNTVVVSGPPDVLEVVAEVIKDLDSDPTEEQAVFVYSVKNAQATKMAEVLNKLFDQASATTGRAGSAQTQRGRDMRQQQGSSTGTQIGAGVFGEVYVVADEDTNSLMVMTASKNFERLKEIMDDLDRPVPQVLIKVLIAEVTHDESLDLGSEFSALNLRISDRGTKLFTDLGVASQPEGLIFSLVEKNVEAALRALETVGKLDVLSRPYILTSDNQPASIIVGQEVPFIRSTRTTETGQTINTIQYEDIGIILTVTPHINREGLVIMDVLPEISTLTGSTVPISETVDAPVFAKRSAKSRIAIRDGQTIVIGGLMEDRKTENIKRVPVLGHIPLLGWFFRRTVTETTKTELLIFLTPHVAKEANALEAMSKDELDGTKVVPGAVRPGAFDEHMKGMQRGANQLDGKDDR